MRDMPQPTGPPRNERRPGQLPLDQQVTQLTNVLSGNAVLVEVLTRARVLNLPGWYITAGCVFQTVWNAMTGRPPGFGIKDYDLFYFDGSDLSWEAEDAVIRQGAEHFADVAGEVEIRNEARVHLWYERRFGVPAIRYTCTEDAIASFPATTCAVGVRLGHDDSWEVYAPYGLTDVFDLVVRPNPVQNHVHTYRTKSARWTRIWPELTVLPWP